MSEAARGTFIKQWRSSTLAFEVSFLNCCVSCFVSLTVAAWSFRNEGRPSSLSPIHQCVWYFFYCSSLVDIVLSRVSATADRRALSAGLLGLFHQPCNVILSFLLFTQPNKLEFMSVHDDRGCSCFSASPGEALNPETLLQDKLGLSAKLPLQSSPRCNGWLWAHLWRTGQSGVSGGMKGWGKP